MYAIQQQEEIDHVNGWNPADQFAGFDRGDVFGNDAPDETSFRVVGRLTTEAGKRVVVGVWEGGVGEGFATVTINGNEVFAEFDGLERALVVGRWWLAGCPC
jgi:hypothetical protein